MQSFNEYYEQKSKEVLARQLVDSGVDIEEFCEMILYLARNNKFDEHFLSEGIWGGIKGMFQGAKQAYQQGSQQQNQQQQNAANSKMIQKALASITQLQQTLTSPPPQGLGLPAQYVQNRFQQLQPLVKDLTAAKDKISQPGYQGNMNWNYQSAAQKAAAQAPNTANTATSGGPAPTVADTGVQNAVQPNTATATAPMTGNSSNTFAGTNDPRFASRAAFA